MKHYIKKVNLTKSDEFLISSIAQYFSEKNFPNIEFKGSGNPNLLKLEGEDAFVSRYMNLTNKLATENYVEVTEKNVINEKLYNLELDTQEMSHLKSIYMNFLSKANFKDGEFEASFFGLLLKRENLNAELLAFVSLFDKINEVANDL